MHTAPGHGQDDFVIGQRYGIAGVLPGRCALDGCFRPKARRERCRKNCSARLSGRLIPFVIEFCKHHGALAGQAKVEHSYPHCWRCHNPVIFRATEQWFIGMERERLRTRARRDRAVKWHPAWGEDRMTNMIAMRPDWCISRQRVWGVPIIVFYCEGCSEPFTEKRVLDRVVEMFREHTADVWYSKDPRPN